MTIPPTTSRIASARLVFQTRNQSAADIEAAVKLVLGKAGCPSCGLLSVLNVELLGDPGPELTNVNVVSARFG
jgi:hypothetical protein